MRHNRIVTDTTLQYGFVAAFIWSPIVGFLMPEVSIPPVLMILPGFGFGAAIGYARGKYLQLRIECRSLKRQYEQALFEHEWRARN